MRALPIVVRALLGAAAFLAGCGDNLHPARDGAVGDGPGPDGAGTDAATADGPAGDGPVTDGPLADAPPPDAPPPDAPPPVTSVWVFGDFLSNNLAQLGRFVHETATPPLTLTPIPATGGLNNDDFPIPFSISADDATLAYSASSTVPNRFDLYVANADGSNAVVVYQAPLMVTITDVALSPDKTKIAFRASGELPMMFDVYVATATAGATPVKVSPDRTVPNVNLSASHFLVWSPDSRHLLFGGDFHVDKEVELWSADTATVQPTATPLLTDAQIEVTTDPRGVLEPFAAFTAGGKVVFQARIGTDGFRHLYEVDPGGTGFRVLPGSTITRTDNSPSESRTFGLSPDRATIAFGADGILAGAFEIYTMPADGSAAPARITAGTAVAGREPNRFQPLFFSPDGQQVAFVADYDVNDKEQPWVAALGAQSPHRLAVIGGAADAGRDVMRLAWTRDGASIYAIADADTDNDFKLYRLEAAMTDQTPVLYVDVPMSGDVFNVVTRFP